MATATAEKVKRLGYNDIRKEAGFGSRASNLPKSRREMPIGRGGEMIQPRNMELSADKLADLRKLYENGDKLPNPQNRGSYYAIIEAYKKLGVDKKHPIKLVISTIREIMSDSKSTDADGKVVFPKDNEGKTAWQRFRDKEPATEREDGAADPIERIITNHEVLQRVNTVTSTTPYGLKLLQVGQKVLKTAGCVIDLFKGETDKDILGRLNTDSDTPINELKRQRGASAKVAKTGKPKAAKKAAPAKKAKVSKPKTVKVEKDAAIEAPKPKVTKAKKVKSDHPASDKVLPAQSPSPEVPSELAASEPAPVEDATEAAV